MFFLASEMEPNILLFLKEMNKIVSETDKKEGYIKRWMTHLHTNAWMNIFSLSLSVLISSNWIFFGTKLYKSLFSFPIENIYKYLIVSNWNWIKKLFKRHIIIRCITLYLNVVKIGLKPLPLFKTIVALIKYLIILKYKSVQSVLEHRVVAWRDAN